MGSISNLSHNLQSKYPFLSCESITKKDGPSFILIRSPLPEVSGYLPSLNAVVESGVVKLLSYHGRTLKEEDLSGGIILEQLNEGKLFFCIGIGSHREDLEDSALKNVFSEPSKDGDVLYRSRSCSFFLEESPGICINCRMFLESIHKVQETSASPIDWDMSSNHKDFEEEEDVYDDIWEYSEEEEEHKNSPLTCKVCSRTFTRKCAYDHHCRLHTSEKDMDFEEEKDDYKDDDWEKAPERLSVGEEECPKCEKVYKESTINNHLKNCKRKMTLSKEDITCKICQKSFSNKGSHNRHYNLHTVRMNLDESINCPLCKKCLDNRKCLNDHIQGSHDSSKGCCGLCYELMPIEDLPRHFEKRHNLSYRHLCPECGQKFKFPFELKYHIAKHHDMGGDKFVVCDQCGRGQPHQRALVQHIRVCHNKSKEFPCHLCKKVFYVKSRLQQHIPIHSAVKPFKCSLCTYCCARKDNVFIHIRRVHKKEPSSKDVVANQTYDDLCK